VSKKYIPNLTVNKTEFVLVAHEKETDKDGFINFICGIPELVDDITESNTVKCSTDCKDDINTGISACKHDIEYINIRYPNDFTNIVIYAIETYIDFNSGESTIKIYEIKDDNWFEIGG
jgi:hypothetical protein